jgi:hypothetical protein
MFRRDEYLELLGNENSNEVLERKMKDLEKYIDDELRKSENIIKMINSTTASTIALENGLEVVNQLKTTNIVHRDISVESNKRINGTNGVSYAIWDDDLKYLDGKIATSTPWNDIVIAETSNINDTQYVFDGKLRIKCPDNTNKFLAKMLADMYMNVGKTDNKGKLLGGFWSLANRPNTENNSISPSNLRLEDAVKVLYDKTNNIVYLEFKLF